MYLKKFRKRETVSINLSLSILPLGSVELLFKLTFYFFSNNLAIKPETALRKKSIKYTKNVYSSGCT
jgi:hypothetical protein